MKTLRILVAEDDALIGMLLSDLLTEMGHKVCSIVATEAETVAAAIAYRPDLLIVDARLGTGSGIAAVETILSKGFIHHFFTSGDTLTVMALKPGAVVVGKPFGEKDLERAIQRVQGVAAPC